MIICGTAVVGYVKRRLLFCRHRWYRKETFLFSTFVVLIGSGRKTGGGSRDDEYADYTFHQVR